MISTEFGKNTQLSTRADKSEKSRKEVEHRVNFNEERIEKLTADILTAKKTTRFVSMFHVTGGHGDVTKSPKPKNSPRH